MSSSDLVRRKQKNNDGNSAGNWQEAVISQPLTGSENAPRVSFSFLSFPPRRGNFYFIVFRFLSVRPLSRP